MSLPKTPSFRLEGKHALVVGASSGIGRACAVGLAESGAKVVAVARNKKALLDLEKSCREVGYSLETTVLDITNLEATRKLLCEKKEFDVVVNSAGLARHGAAIKTNAEDFDQVMDINVRAAFFLAQQAAKNMMMSQIAGSIITISSQMAFVGGIDRSVYCASKHAVEGFTKAMAIEWGPKNIRINTVCPTFVRTPLTEPTFQNKDQLDWIKQKIKLNRVGKVEDIMGGVVFLASDASALITGTSLLIDGGWTAD